MYGGSLLLAFLLNYLLSWVTWARLDTNKKWSFIFPLIHCYKQFGGTKLISLFKYYYLYILEAFQIICLIWRSPDKGMKKKKEYVQSVAMHETFMESVPTFLIMVFLMVQAFNDQTLTSIIFDYTRLDSVLLFVTTFSSSGLSSCFGLTKCLKNSVAAVIAPVGPAEGVLSARFILAFFGIVIITSFQSVVNVLKNTLLLQHVPWPSYRKRPCLPSWPYSTTRGRPSC